MSQVKSSRERVSEKQSVRCLQTVEHIYRVGVASIQSLVELTGSDVATIEKDVDLLRRGGLQIHVDDKVRYRIGQAIPGFSLRLRAPEVTVAWAKISFCSRCWLNVGHDLPEESLAGAREVLGSALQKYYPSEEVYARPGCAGFDPFDLEPEPDGNGLHPLRGEAKRVCKRLRIIDLAESGHGCRREQLTNLLGVSDRTIGYDLRVLRKAGLEISFLRDRHCYWVDTLHTHLTQVLSRPGGAVHAGALLNIFKTAEEADRRAKQGRWCSTTSRKIQRSIKLIFKGRERELQPLTVLRNTAI
ncbi:MAG: hypothetical protein MI923_11270 [Phycisphaerales bacterium]|nr:hypothetical protein [Phycisphaerales bacterium]